MNPNYNTYMSTIHTPATKPRMGDLCIFIGHIVVSVKPTLAIRAEPDYIALAVKWGNGITLKKK